MDVENPLHEDDIPVARLVCIEVIGQPMDCVERETSVVNIQFSCNKCIYRTFRNFCTFIGCIVCFGGFFIFITGFSFV
uniref:Uncharacterized protein n=1 Tax=viral metagenome TaxID=1070528 RepID=A0A6C0K3I9_9ZZZZ